MNELPIIETLTCDGCGACCLEQGSPPGYIGFLSGVLDLDQWPDAEDKERYLSMPPEARRSLKSYLDLLKRGELSGDGPCVWFDQKTRRCRHYEHRPQICRDLDVGSEGCLYWRKAYRIPLTAPCPTCTRGLLYTDDGPIDCPDCAGRGVVAVDEDGFRLFNCSCCDRGCSRCRFMNYQRRES